MLRFGGFISERGEFVCPSGVLPALNGPISGYSDHQRTSASLALDFRLKAGSLVDFRLKAGSQL